MTFTPKPGDRVRAAFDATVQDIVKLADGEPLLEFAYDHGGERMNCALPLSALTLERLTPTVLPKPGEIWSTDDNGLWLAQRYFADFDNDADVAGCNAQGWRVLMVPLNGGPYGDPPGRPEEIHQRYGLRKCVASVPVCMCQDEGRYGALLHTAACPQYPASQENGAGQ